MTAAQVVMDDSKSTDSNLMFSEGWWVSFNYIEDVKGGGERTTRFGECELMRLLGYGEIRKSNERDLDFWITNGDECCWIIFFYTPNSGLGSCTAKHHSTVPQVGNNNHFLGVEQNQAWSTYTHLSHPANGDSRWNCHHCCPFAA